MSSSSDQPPRKRKILIEDESTLSKSPNLSLVSSSSLFSLPEPHSEIFEVHYCFTTLRAHFTAVSGACIKTNIIFEKRLCKLTNLQKAILERKMDSKLSFDSGCFAHRKLLEELGLPNLKPQRITLPDYDEGYFMLSLIHI